MPTSPAKLRRVAGVLLGILIASAPDLYESYQRWAAEDLKYSDDLIDLLAGPNAPIDELGGVAFVESVQHMPGPLAVLTTTDLGSGGCRDAVGASHLLLVPPGPPAAPHPHETAGCLRALGAGAEPSIGGAVERAVDVAIGGASRSLIALQKRLCAGPIVNCRQDVEYLPRARCRELPTDGIWDLGVAQPAPRAALRATLAECESAYDRNLLVSRILTVQRAAGRVPVGRLP